MNKQMVLCFLYGMVVPFVLLAGAVAIRSQPADEEQTQTQAQKTPVRTILVEQADGTAEEMVLEDYLTGVVLAEMPADFHSEALKAQAVVARTYAMRRLESGKHEPAAVCMESACCQGYRSERDYLDQGGSVGSVDKVRQAVADTAGQVLTYEGELIDATYFSSSGGWTEAAVEVWGTDVPYLQSVESPGEETVYGSDEQTFSAEEFARLLDLSDAGDPEDWFGEVTHTDGGGVDTMQIQGEAFEGTELRRLLGLRSTVFEVEAADGRILITTHGFGHRVGMSQYGAQAMAESGSGYEQILTHYYVGTKLEAWE